VARRGDCIGLAKLRRYWSKGHNPARGCTEISKGASGATLKRGGSAAGGCGWHPGCTEASAGSWSGPWFCA